MTIRSRCALALAGVLATCSPAEAAAAAERRVVRAPPEAPETPRRATAFAYLAGVGAAAMTVPATMLLGTALGRLSPSFVGAALPGLLLFAIVPPFAVTGAAWLAGRDLAPGTRFHPAFWAAFGVNLAGMVLGAVAGVWTENGTSLALFTLAESLLMPAGVALVMHYTRRPPKATPPPLRAAPSPTPERPFLDPARVAAPTAPALTLPLARFTF